jgi:hypothetical protein
MQLSKLCALALLALLPTPALASGTPEAGFQAAALAYPGQSLTRTLANGDVITYDGATVDRYDAAGTLIANLATFPSSVFTGAFAIDPTETFAIVGESLFGDIFRVDLTLGGLTLLANLNFNYDADFATDGTVIVSAAVGGFGVGNDLVRLDPVTGTTTFLAHLAGPSGPIEFDNFGNLYYATVAPSFPSPPASTDILIFLAADLAGADCALPGGCLDETNAVLFASGYDGASDMTLEPQTGRLYLAENNFTTGTSRIWAVAGGPAGGTAPFVEEALFNWTTSLEGFGGSTAATLQAFQPASDARLQYNTTDFFSSWERVSVTALRPTLTISGPGTTGPGQVDLNVTGAAPGGGLLYFYGSTALVAGSESAFGPGSVAPLFTALDLLSLESFGAILPLDGAGASLFSFTNTGGLEGLVSIQGLLFDSTYGLLLGTTNLVDF